MNRIDLFGIEMDAVTRDFMLLQVDLSIANNEKKWLTFINVSILVEAYRNSEVCKLLNTADFRLCDGMGLIYGSRLLKKPLPDMVSGPFFLNLLIEHAEQKGYRLFLLGDEPGIIDQAVTAIRSRYPNIQIIGFRNGYFTPDENDQIIKEINLCDADILIVGMGFPREREFISHNKVKLSPFIYVDVGGAFKVWAGVHHIAPNWLSKSGLEWFYRMMQEPQRLLRRYLITNTIFIWIIIKELILRRKVYQKSKKSV